MLVLQKTCKTFCEGMPPVRWERVMNKVIHWSQKGSHRSVKFIVFSLLWLESHVQLYNLLSACCGLVLSMIWCVLRPTPRKLEMTFLVGLSLDVRYRLARNLFASFFHQPRHHPATAMALIKMIKSVFHPISNFRIGDKNQRIFFACNIGIWKSCRFLESSLILPHCH